MLPPGPRQRSARVTPWVIGGLVLALALLLGYQLWNRERHDEDPALAQDLQSAALPAPANNPAPAGDWPQWRGPNRDGVSPETGLRTDWPPDGPPVLWKAKSGVGFSSFAVHAGRVYTLLQDGDQEAVVCWDADTGEPKWRFPYPSNFPGALSYGAGPHSTPAVDGDFVYTVGTLGMLHCLKAATGEKVWAHDLLQEYRAPNLKWGVSFSPLVLGDLVYTNPGGPDGNSVVAFDTRDGKEVWKALGDPAGYSSPVAATLAGVPHVLFFTGRGLVGLGPKDGKEYWHFDWPTNEGINAATPIVVGDYVFISSGYGKGCALLKVSGDGPGSLRVQRVYQNNRMCNHFASSVRLGDYIYGFHDDFLTCLELRTGKVRWKERGFHKGSLLAAEGQLIVLGEGGNLALVEATPDEYRKKVEFQLSQQRCWTVPVLAGGKLYVRDEEQVWCLDLRKP
jgi:outer membrane protein assembly factor BamB